MSTQAYDDRGSGSGWLEFVAIIMFSVGFFRIISAIAYFADSHKINDLTNGLFGGQTWVWGLWDLVIAALALLAGSSILSGGGYGRVFGYVWGVLVIVQSFTIARYAPWYAAISITLGVLVIWGLASSPRRAEDVY